MKIAKPLANAADKITEKFQALSLPTWDFCSQAWRPAQLSVPFYYPVGTLAVFAATIGYLCQCFTDRGLSSYGDHPLDAHVFSCCSAGRCCMDLISHSTWVTGQRAMPDWTADA
ncbi:MAG: hypothetical protein JO066_12385 [Verrucomicrobia bacterium]|nr:hypothetical protein [Verrucomicrobiota bacterium]